MRAELERRLAVLVEPLERAVLDGVREFESEPDRVRVDLGVVPVFVDERPLIGLAGLLDWRSSGRLSAILRSRFFSGASSERLLTLGERRWPCERLVLVGVGARDEFDQARARELGSRCVEIATGLGSDSVLIALPSGAIERGLVEVAFGSLLDAIADSGDAPERPPEDVSDSGETGDAAGDEGDARADAQPESPAPALESLAETGSKPEPEPVEAAEPRWWVVADESVVARLRRVRSGPPRAARGGPGLYT